METERAYSEKHVKGFEIDKIGTHIIPLQFVDDTSVTLLC